MNLSLKPLSMRNAVADRLARLVAIWASRDGGENRNHGDGEGVTARRRAHNTERKVIHQGNKE